MPPLPLRTCTHIVACVLFLILAGLFQGTSASASPLRHVHGIQRNHRHGFLHSRRRHEHWLGAMTWEETTSGAPPSPDVDTLRFRTETRRATTSGLDHGSTPAALVGIDGEQEQEKQQVSDQRILFDTNSDNKLLPRPTVADPPTRSSISDSSIWFFLTSFGIFSTGLIWNLYIRVGVPRMERLELDARMRGRDGDAELVRMPSVPVHERVAEPTVPGTFIVGGDEIGTGGRIATKRKKVDVASAWLRDAFRGGDRLSKL